MSAEASPLASFIPARLAQYLGERPDAPSHRRARGVALYTDIAGSCALADRLASRHGAAGVDELSRVLNSCFSVLIDIIEQAGGEIVQFAGDAMLVVWIADDDTLVSAVQAAVRAAGALGTVRARQPELAALGISLRTGVGAGDLLAARVGGAPDRWEIVVAGGAVSDAFRAMSIAPAGGSAVAPSVAVLAGGSLNGVALPDGFFSVEGLTAQEVGQSHTVSHAWAAETYPLELDRLVPEVIRSQIRDGLDPWLAELRHLSVMFVNIHGLQLHTDEDALKLHVATCAIKEILRSNNGYFRQLSIDDKGIVVVAAFGLPPVRRERHPADPLRSAQRIQASLADLGLEASVGIASGRVFCGAIGSLIRREYAIVGNTVNLAARLMSVEQGAVICDGPTAEEARGVAELQELPPRALKGFPELVRPSRLGGLREGEHATPGAAPRATGREREVHEVLTRVGRLGNDESEAFVFEGEPGIGKSTLVRTIAWEARKAGVRVLEGGATWDGQTAPYHAWAPVVADILGLSGEMDRATRSDTARAFLARDPAWARTAPLLNDVLPLELADTPFSESLTGTDRAEELRELIARLLTAHRGSEALLLVIDDVQWCDPASWSVILKGLPSVRKLLTVLGSRPLDAPSAEIGAFLDSPHTRRRRLDPLGPQAIADAAASAAGVAALDPVLTRWLVDRLAGNPFFAQQLALALIQRGLLYIAAGRVVRSPGPEDLAAFALPVSVEALVLTRIDLLDPVQQILLKTASVIGPRFTEGEMNAVHPLPEQRARLRRDLDALIAAQLARVDHGDFAFTHQIVLDVAYGVMVGEQRRATHERVARFLEEMHAGDLAPRYAQLARHWLAASVDEPSFKYLELAATEVSRKGAYREAVTHLTNALALDDSRGNPIERSRRARWHRQLGDAHEGIGNMATAQQHMVQALALHGRRLPTSERGWSTLLTRALLRQLAHLLIPPRVLPVGSAERERAMEIISASVTISEVKHQENSATGSAAAIFLAANACDQLGAAAGVARPYSFVGVVFSMMGSQRLGRRYFARARAIARQVGDVSGEVRNDMAEAYILHWAGALDRADELLDRGRMLAEKHGLRREAEMVEATHAGVNLSRARYRGPGRDRAARLLETSRERSRPLGEVWALLMLAADYLRTGELDDAARCITELHRHTDLLTQEQVLCDGRELALHLRREDWARVRTTADRLADRLGISRDGREGATRFVVLTMWECFWNYCEACIAMAERASKTEDGRALENAQQAWKAYRRFAKRCAITQPAALAFEGRVRCLAGDGEAGLQRLRHALQQARHMGLPFVTARALQYLGESEQPGSAERRGHLREAKCAYEAIGAGWDLRRVEHLLAVDGS